MGFYKNGKSRDLPRHLAIRPFTNLFFEMQTPGSFDRFFGMRSNFRVFVDALLYRYMENLPPFKRSSTTLTVLPAICIHVPMLQPVIPSWFHLYSAANLPTWLSGLLNECASNCFKKTCLGDHAFRPGFTGHKLANWELLHPFKSNVSFFFGAGKLLPPTETLRDIFCRLPFRPKDRTFLCLFSLGPNLSLAAGNMPKKAVRNLQPHHPQEKRETTKLRNCKDSYFYV